MPKVYIRKVNRCIHNMCGNLINNEWCFFYYKNKKCEDIKIGNSTAMDICEIENIYFIRAK